MKTVTPHSEENPYHAQMMVFSHLLEYISLKGKEAQKIFIFCNLSP